MSTTAGSWALVGAKSSKNSAMAQTLIDAGLIILGKTNMTVRLHNSLNVLVAKLTRTGIRGNENDHDDARVVGLRWPDDLSLCRRN